MLHIISRVVITPDNTIIRGKPWGVLKQKLNEPTFNFNEFRANLSKEEIAILKILD